MLADGSHKKVPDPFFLWGITDTSITFPRLLDAVGMLGCTGAWADEDQPGLIDWMDEHLNWLLTSQLGRQEADAKNNHSVYYDVQASALLGDSRRRI